MFWNFCNFLNFLNFWTIFFCKHTISYMVSNFSCEMLVHNRYHTTSHIIKVVLQGLT